MEDLRLWPDLGLKWKGTSSFDVVLARNFDSIAVGKLKDGLQFCKSKGNPSYLVFQNSLRTQISHQPITPKNPGAPENEFVFFFITLAISVALRFLEGLEDEGGGWELSLHHLPEAWLGFGEVRVLDARKIWRLEEVILQQVLGFSCSSIFFY